MAVHNAPRKSTHTNRAAAIDIGYSTVRAVELEIAGERVRIVKRGSSPLPTACWDNLSSNRDEIVFAIKSAMSAGGITTTKIVAALPRRLVTLKYARLPHAAPEQIRGMVMYEAQQYVPFPLDEVILDYQVVSDDADEMTTVMIVAARRTLIDDLMAILDKANLQVTRLSVSALALSELGQDDGVPTGVLDVEPGEMDIAVVSAGRLLFTRAAHLNESVDTSAGSQILAGEVARSLAAYQNEYRAQQVSKVLVGAEASSLAQIEETLSGSLGVPVARMNGRMLPAADPDATAYATAIGLALQADGLSVSRINLVPSTREEKKQAARRMAGSVFAAATTVVLLVVTVWFIQKTISTRNREYRDARIANTDLGYTETKYKRMKTDHDKAVLAYNSALAGLGRDKLTVDTIKTINDAVPGDGKVYLTQLAIDRAGSIAIHGNTASESAVTEFVTKMQSQNKFTEAKLVYLGDSTVNQKIPGALPTMAQANASTSISFIITCKLAGAQLPASVPAASNRVVQTSSSGNGSTAKAGEGKP